VIAAVRASQPVAQRPERREESAPPPLLKEQG
jgi:hypothetical protein